MTIKKAINHIIFKFNKVWKTTPKDVEALEYIMNFVEDKHIKEYNDYQLFAKLYIMVYSQFLEKYKATVFDDIPVKELTRYLNQPIEKIIKRFVCKLNENELYSLYEEIGVENKHPALMSQEEDDDYTSKIKESIKDENNLKRFMGEIWDYETVKDSLQAQINNTINLLR